MRSLLLRQSPARVAARSYNTGKGSSDHTVLWTTPSTNSSGRSAGASPSNTGKALRCPGKALVGYRGGKGRQWYGHRRNDRTTDPLSPRVGPRDQTSTHG